MCNQIKSIYACLCVLCLSTDSTDTNLEISQTRKFQTNVENFFLCCYFKISHITIKKHLRQTQSQKMKKEKKHAQNPTRQRNVFEFANIYIR